MRRGSLVIFEGLNAPPFVEGQNLDLRESSQALTKRPPQVKIHYRLGEHHAVGRLYLAEAAAELVHGNPDAQVRFDGPGRSHQIGRRAAESLSNRNFAR